MITCPNNEKYRKVSWTIKPVTQVAEVAVNRDSKKGMERPERVAMGSISKRVPSNISSAKLTTITLAGFEKKLDQNLERLFTFGDNTNISPVS